MVWSFSGPARVSPLEIGESSLGRELVVETEDVERPGEREVPGSDGVC